MDKLISASALKERFNNIAIRNISFSLSEIEMIIDEFPDNTESYTNNIVTKEVIKNEPKTSTWDQIDTNIFKCHNCGHIEFITPSFCEDCGCKNTVSYNTKFRKGNHNKKWS